MAEGQIRPTRVGCARKKREKWGAWDSNPAPLGCVPAYAATRLRTDSVTKMRFSPYEVYLLTNLTKLKTEQRYLCCCGWGRSKLWDGLGMKSGGAGTVGINRSGTGDSIPGDEVAWGGAHVEIRRAAPWLFLQTRRGGSAEQEGVEGRTREAREG